MIAALKKDSVWKGLLFGLMIPVVVYLILLLIYLLMDSIGVFSDVGFAEDFRTRTLALISICSNLIFMQTFRRFHHHHETTRGILIATMILVGVWFWKFGFKMLQF
ncbi:MAG: hypothetical protein SH808_07330 [Saprospiraceae bacterium]|nr:hypothetical protein [Saprospiraceae bacterium]